MGRFDELKALIDENITTNGQQEITGAVLNSTLDSIVDATDAELTELSQEWQEVKDANFNVILDPHVEVVDMGTATAATIEPDKYYIFGEVATLAVGLVAAQTGYIGNYAFQFTSPADAPTTLSLPIDVKFPVESDSMLNIKEARIYQISILNGLVIATSWEA